MLSRQSGHFGMQLGEKSFRLTIKLYVRPCGLFRLIAWLNVARCIFLLLVHRWPLDLAAVDLAHPRPVLLRQPFGCASVQIADSNFSIRWLSGFRRQRRGPVIAARFRYIIRRLSRLFIRFRIATFGRADRFK
jgi:hypothetical protein